MAYNPPTVCEVTYDVEWFDYPPVIPSRSAGSFKSYSHYGRPQTMSEHSRGGGGGGGSSNTGISGDTASVASAVPSFLTYYEYLKNYYWENPAPIQTGGASGSPSLPVRSQTSLTWYHSIADELPSGRDRSISSLPALSRAANYNDYVWPAADDRRSQVSASSEGQLKWVDALNTWVPAKKHGNAHPFISIINSPPRVERYMASREGLHRKRRDEAYNRRLQRKSYSTPLYDPDAVRRSRTVRFEAPRTASNTPQPMVLPEQIEVPQPVWEDETATTLEGEAFDFHPQHASEQLEQVVVVRLKEKTESSDSSFEPVIVNQPPDAWLQELAKKRKTPTPEPVVEQAEEDPKSKEEDVPDAQPEPVPEPPPKSPSPQPPPPARTKIEEPEPSSSSSTSREPTPPPEPPSRRPTVDPEEHVQEQANLASLMSRLTSLQRVKPKLQPKKAEKQVVEKTPKPPKPKPEKPPPVAAPPKPVKQPKPAKPVRQPKPKPEPKEKKIIPKPAPKPPPPVRTPRTPRTLVRAEEKEPADKPVPLPVSLPEEVVPPPEPVKEEPPPQPAPTPHRAPVKKKEKLPPPPPRRKTPSPPPKPPTPQFEHKDKGDWMRDDSDKEEENKEPKEEEPVQLDLPTLPPALPELNKPVSAKSGAGRGTRAAMAAPLVAIKTKPRWGQKQRDTSLADDEERERLAEERRRRHQAAMERHKAGKGGQREHGNHNGPNFDDYGFLAKYCILTPATTDKYRYTFDHMDEGGKGWLTEEETAYGLRAINPSLSTSERNYLFRILEIAGHKMSKGTDFKLFSILAALSQRVMKLDEWARNMMAELDYQHLERKLFLCRTLWECNVDEDTRTISLDQLIVELRAGGVSPQHEQEVRRKLADLRQLDFFDFLMYVPLFITIHETVVSDPLSDSRTF